MSFKQQMTDKVRVINQWIERLWLAEETISSAEKKDKLLREAVHYSLCLGGKRIRPLLLVETYRMFCPEQNKEWDDVVSRFAVALEMIHSYSLVHDDLPCMDNDEFRRGNPTTHKVYGEAVALLAGDSLLNQAFVLTSDASLHVNIDEENAARRFFACAKATEVLARCAGLGGMVSGQMVDIELNGKTANEEFVLQMYEQKTSRLLEAAMQIGALLGFAAPDEVRLLQKAANNIGLAFQIRDDILDVTSTTEQLGKPVKSDIKNDKPTYCAIVGIESAQIKVEDYTRTAFSLLQKLPYDTEFLTQLFEYLMGREK